MIVISTFDHRYKMGFISLTNIHINRIMLLIRADIVFVRLEYSDFVPSRFVPCQPLLATIQTPIV